MARLPASGVLLAALAAGILLADTWLARAQQAETGLRPFVAPRQAGDWSPADSVLKPFLYAGPNPPLKWIAPKVMEDSVPIDLSTALRLVNARSLDVAIAAQRIRQASALYEQAAYAWLPTVTIGPDYYRHDGRFQDAQGNPITVSRTSFSAGAAVTATFAPGDVIFARLAARQVMQARQSDLNVASNNILLTVAEAYFNVQQARGEMAGAEATVKHAEELVHRTTKLAPGLLPPVEAVRARTELARRKQAVASAQERWRVASADLMRVLRLDPTARINPVEPPHLCVALVSLKPPVDALIPIGMRNRPELASQQALVEATLNRLRQERIRPLVPSVVLSGASPGSGTASTISVFGGGNDAMRNYGASSNMDLQLVWVFQNMGLGNLAKIKERQADNRAAVLELFRAQDLVAAEVVQAYAQAQSAAERMVDAEAGLKDAADSVDKNFQGLSQTRRAGDLIILMIRPQEVIAAIQALAQAYADYYGTVADFNRAQFRLFRALGFPPHLVTEGGCGATLLPPITSENAPSRRD